MKKIARRKFIQSSAMIGTSVLLFGNSSARSIFLNNQFDLLILNGSVIDGSGKKEFTADVGIKDGRIKAIGNLKNADAARIIDAKGLKVSPGFIDIHSHTDTDLIINPKAESKIRQGVTTEITGQDGSSVAPVAEWNIERTLKSYRDDYGEELSYRTFDEFLTYFSGRKFSVNLASMIGLGTLREVVVGYDDRPATDDELNRMKLLVENAMAAGAYGLSTGLEYTPGSFASTRELIELCRASEKAKRLYATHMRNEDNTVLEAIEEAITIARESDASLEISHLKVSGKSNWHKADAALELIDKAAAEGMNIHADRYTYVAYHTGLANLFPLWARDGGKGKFIERLKDDSLKAKMKEYSEKKVANLDGEWNGVLISAVGKDDLKNLQGKTIKQIAEENENDGFETAVKIIIDSENDVSMVGFGMEEKSTEKILAHPLVMISSDAGSHAPYPPMTRSIAHPRAYGTFPRAIAKYVRERKICSLEEMIKKMTSMPADKLKLKQKGRLSEGKDADVVIFDFSTIRDKAEFTDPHQYPEGIPFVIVNGEIVIDKGEHSGAMPGKVLRS